MADTDNVLDLSSNRAATSWYFRGGAKWL